MQCTSLFASKSSIILFLMTGADHHHVYFRLSEWLGGARLPLCSEGSHHPVSAPEKRGLASGHHQPLQRHSVRFCLGSQLQLLERCLHPYTHAEKPAVRCSYPLKVPYSNIMLRSLFMCSVVSVCESKCVLHVHAGRSYA